MKVLVSDCLLGTNCKYSGGNNYSKKLEEFLKDKECVAVCPEVLGGLSVPRHPCEIVSGVVMNDAGENVDGEFREGAAKAAEIAEKEEIDLAVLQPRSPSCGIGIIYDGSFSGKKIRGNGVFAQLLIDKGFKVISEEDL